jgi:hypothetical protein
LSNEVEAKQFDIGTTSIRLVRVGNVIQIVFSSPLDADDRSDAGFICNDRHNDHVELDRRRGPEFLYQFIMATVFTVLLAVVCSGPALYDIPGACGEGIGCRRLIPHSCDFGEEYQR